MEEVQKKKEKNIFYYLLLFLSFISTLSLFVITILNNLEDGIKLNTLIPLALFSIFSIFFIITNYKKTNRVWPTIMATISLILLNSLQIALNLNFINLTNNVLPNFSNRSLTEVIKWSEKNNIDIETVYEFSDMVEEYYVINQDIEPDTKLNEIKKLTIAISEGPNPEKEVIIPDMDTWNSERVLTFIKENYLTNIEVEFQESSKIKDTVIEQEGKGNRKRNDLLKLVFSRGEEKDEKVGLIDLTNKSKFEAVFWLKQHTISYELKEDFSNKIKRGNVISQDKKAGTIIKEQDEKVLLTISKGPKIKVPDLINMNMTEITEWIIKNKLKIEFHDEYDDSVKKNKVIKANYKKGDVIEQKTLITITISKGKLTMPKVDDINELKSWLEKYQIPYQEEYQFDERIEQGKIIKTSHKEGDTIKNNETIIITISQGKKTTIPKLIGMKKQDIIKKLKELNLNYNFIYEYDNKEKDIAIKQSMKENSEVSENTTITITLSNGKKPTNSSNSNKNQTTNKPSNNNTNTTPPSQPETPSCTAKTYTVSSKIRDIFTSYDGYNGVSNALYKFFADNYPNVKITVIGVSGSGMSPGSYIEGLRPGSSITSCNSNPYTKSIAQ